MLREEEHWSRLAERLKSIDSRPLCGRVTQVKGLSIISRGPRAAVGELCWIAPHDGQASLPCQVIGFADEQLILLPLGSPSGVAPGCVVRPSRAPLQVPVGYGLVGRVLDGLGRPLDGRPLPPCDQMRPIFGLPPLALSRNRVTQQLHTGIRVIDGLLTLGIGQRVGIFAGAGVGKSTLLGSLARNTQADVVVIGLVGERGREVRDFIERDLGEGVGKSVLVVATSDQPALLRITAAFTATTIAEGFRDQGAHVLLLLDSLTRFATAQREVGLAAGEPPTTKGYPPSVFALLPQLLERAGHGRVGAITALYTVLVDGDDLNEPISDAVRSILDGHVVLSRTLAERGQYPAVDVARSISRVMQEVVEPSHRQAAERLKRCLSIADEMRDLVAVGAYETGHDALADRALTVEPQIRAFLAQDAQAAEPFDQILTQLCELAEAATP